MPSKYYEIDEVPFQETKLDVFNKLTLDHGFCVGMKVNGITKWLDIPKKSDGKSALARFLQLGDGHTIKDSGQWTSLINGSFVNVRTITMNY